LGSQPAQGVEPAFCTTTFDLEGYRTTRHLGVVRGIIVRSRSMLETLGAIGQTVRGGDITIFTEMCEEARRQAFDRMRAHAAELGANAVVGVRYDTTDVMDGVAEVLAYGTAVVVEPTS
jgi:uncharacterized protein YbjQ (UPF0145 family)